MPILTTPITNPYPNLKLHLLPPKLLNFHQVKSCRVQRFALHCIQNPSNIHSGNDHEDATKNLNLREFTDLVGDLQSSPYVPLVAQSLLGKKHALAVLASLVAFLVKHIEFVIKPTTQGGADFGVRWNFEWKTPTLPLGEAWSLHSAHAYNGKLYISNKKAKLWPLPNMEALKLVSIKSKQKMDEFIVPIIEKIVEQSILKGKTRADIINCMLILLIMTLSIILWRNVFV